MGAGGRNRRIVPEGLGTEGRPVGIQINGIQVAAGNSFVPNFLGAPHLAAVYPDKVAGQHVVPGRPGRRQHVVRNISFFIAGTEEVCRLLEFVGFDPVFHIAFLIDENQVFLYGERIGVQRPEQPGERLRIHGNDHRLGIAVPVLRKHFRHFQKVVHGFRIIQSVLFQFFPADGDAACLVRILRPVGGNGVNLPVYGCGLPHPVRNHFLQHFAVLHIFGNGLDPLCPDISGKGLLVFHDSQQVKLFPCGQHHVYPVRKYVGRNIGNLQLQPRPVCFQLFVDGSHQLVVVLYFGARADVIDGHHFAAGRSVGRLFCLCRSRGSCGFLSRAFPACSGGTGSIGSLLAAANQQDRSEQSP